MSFSDFINFDNGLCGNEVLFSNGRSECNGELLFVNILEVINGCFGEVGDIFFYVVVCFL